MPVWLRLAIGGAATLLVGMGIGRFSYTPLIPAIILDGALSEAEAGYVGAFNLGGYLLGALAVPWRHVTHSTGRMGSSAKLLLQWSPPGNHGRENSPGDAQGCVATLRGYYRA